MSEFFFQCPSCKKEIKADTEWIGQTAECPLCLSMIIVKKTPPTLEKIKSSPEPVKIGKPKKEEKKAGATENNQLPGLQQRDVSKSRNLPALWCAERNIFTAQTEKRVCFARVVFRWYRCKQLLCRRLYRWNHQVADPLFNSDCFSCVFWSSTRGIMRSVRFAGGVRFKSF